MYSVAPFGERRADIRAALNTTVLRNAMTVGEVNQEAAQATYQALESYMPGDKEQVGLEVDPDILNNMTKGG